MTSNFFGKADAPLVARAPYAGTEGGLTACVVASSSGAKTKRERSCSCPICCVAKIARIVIDIRSNGRMSGFSCPFFREDRALPNLIEQD